MGQARVTFDASVRHVITLHWALVSQPTPASLHGERLASSMYPYRCARIHACAVTKFLRNLDSTGTRVVVAWTTRIYTTSSTSSSVKNTLPSTSKPPSRINVEAQSKNNADEGRLSLLLCVGDCAIKRPSRRFLRVCRAPNCYLVSVQVTGPSRHVFRPQMQPVS